MNKNDQTFSFTKSISRTTGETKYSHKKKKKKQRQPTLPLVCEEGRADQKSYTSKEKRHKQALSRRVFKPLILRK